MSSKMFISVLIVLIIAAAGLLIGLTVTSVSNYSGTEIEIPTTNDNVTIKAELVRLEAGSSNVFVLVNENKEMVASQPAEPPLGWVFDSYYTVDQQVSGGVWTFEAGSAAIKITSTEPIAVSTQVADPAGVWVITWIAVVVVIILLLLFLWF